MEYYTENLPDFDTGIGNFATRNARYRAFVCNHFDLKFVSVGGDGNCFFESLSRMVQPDVTAVQLRANCVGLFRSCLDSTQPFFERIVVEMEDELHRELVCSNRRSGVNGLKPSSVAEYIDAVSNDRVWVQGLHWIRAVSFLYDVRIGIVLYGQPFVRFVGSGAATVFLYMTDGYTHFDPLVPWTGSPDRAPLIDEAVPLERRPKSSSVIEIRSDDESSAHGVLDSAPPESSVHVSSESSVHGSRPVNYVPPVSSVHGSQPLHVRPQRTCRMQTRQPSPDPPVRLKRNSHVKKRLLHGGSETDDDVPLVSQAKAKKPSAQSSANPELGDELVLSCGSSFIAPDFRAAIEMLKTSIMVSHSGGHIQARNCSEPYVYLKCTSCHQTMCAAGSKKANRTQWHITLVTSFALQPCHSKSLVDSIPPPAVPFVVAPSDQNPVAAVLPVGPEVECVVCYAKVRRATQCPEGHAWCITCFATTVENQCNPTDSLLGIQKFLSTRGVFCPCCPPDGHIKRWTFDMEPLSAW